MPTRPGWLPAVAVGLVQSALLYAGVLLFGADITSPVGLGVLMVLCAAVALLNPTQRCCAVHPSGPTPTVLPVRCRVSMIFVRSLFFLSGLLLALSAAAPAGWPSMP